MWLLELLGLYCSSYGGIFKTNASISAAEDIKALQVFFQDENTGVKHKGSKLGLITLGT